MAIAVYAGPERELARRKQDLEQAKKAISEYPMISDVFGNLEGYSETEKLTNPVAATLSEATSSVWHNGNPSPQAMAKLAYLEKTLTELKEAKDPIFSNAFVGRLISKNHTTCDSALTELDLYTRLKTLHKDSVITWDPRIGAKRADILFEGFCNVCIEITSLYASQVEGDLKALYEQVAKEVWKQLEEKRVMSLIISTDKLEWKEDGPLDIKASKSKVLKDVKDLACLAFFKEEGESFRFATLINLPHQTEPISKSMRYIEHYDSIGRFLLEHEAEPAIREMIENITPNRIKEAAIHAVMAGPGSNKVAEVKSVMQVPSLAGNHEKRIFINRIQSKLEEKKELQQRKLSIPNILVIRAFNWTLAGYSYDSDESIREMEFEPIRNAIEEWLGKNPIKELAAVVLYEQTPAKSQIIENPNAEAKYRLEIEQIARLLDMQSTPFPQTSSLAPSGR